MLLNQSLTNVSSQGPDGPPGKIGFPGHAVKTLLLNCYHASPVFNCVSIATVAMYMQSLIVFLWQALSRHSSL